MVLYSIIVPTYNRALLLEQALDSLRIHLPRSNQIEILVIDNNSTDETELVVKKYDSDGIPLRYFKENKQGLSFAKNRGIHESSGEVIIFLDDDIEIDSNWFNSIISPLKASPEIGVVGGKVLPFKCAIPRWLPENFYFLVSIFDLGDTNVEVDHVMGGNCAIRREILTQVGVFDVSLGRKGALLLSGEENDLFKRIKKLGYRIFYSGSCIVYHKIQDKLKIEYVLDYAYRLGMSSGLYELKHQKIKYTLKYIQALAFVPVLFFRKSNKVPLARRSVKSAIKFQYYRGYLSHAKITIST